MNYLIIALINGTFLLAAMLIGAQLNKSAKDKNDTSKKKEDDGHRITQIETKQAQTEKDISEIKSDIKGLPEKIVNLWPQKIELFKPSHHRD